MRLVGDALVGLNPFVEKGRQVGLSQMGRVPVRIDVDDLDLIGTSLAWRQCNQRRSGVSIKSLDL